MRAHRSSVYLSGWEYNRLLQADPTRPRISALPASILWNGSHQLWMFEQVYCARESFENEIEATDRLGWVNGTVLRDLQHEGILRTVDWKTLPVELKDRLRRTRTAALERLPEARIRAAINNGEASTLELAKILILEPILDHFGCFESGAPNSISNWSSGRPAPTDPLRAPSTLTHLLANGLQVCRPPGTGISDEANRRQRHVQETVESPMIPHLLAGEGEFQGARGFVPYFRKLERHRDAYEATNSQLTSDWRQNKKQLFSLREAADRHLWPDLHGHWLPLINNADSDEELDRAAQEFSRWIRGALTIAPIVKYLTNRPTSIAVGQFGPIGLSAALAYAGVPLSDAAAAGLSTYVAGTAAGYYLNRITNLALFYQEARRVLAP
ncbi:hypothetical protein SAMN05216482_5565 [Streptomyces sp. PAN_FS17]|nr:hypothetical protein SAMN05216482_5565 [Streptomyces sp. PAN_FS17]